MPLCWPDGDIFGAICVFDTKENHYTGKSKILMVQFRELIESHLALLFQTQRIDSLLESLGDIKESFYPDISGDTIITSDDKDNVILWNRGAESLFGYEPAEILGKPLGSLIAKPFRRAYDDMRQLVLKESAKCNRQTIDITVITKEGIEFPVRLMYTRWRQGNQLSFTAVIRPVVERKRLGEMIQIRNRELSILNTITQSLSRSLRLDEVIHQGLETIVDTLGFTTGAIYLSDNTIGELSLAADKGLTEDLKIATKKVAQDAVNTLLANEEIGTMVNEVNEFSQLELPTQLDYKQYALNLPLISRGKVLGSIVVVSKGESPIEQIQLLQTSSDYLAAAIDNARLFEKTERMSITDGLTELYNKRYFHQVLQAETDRILRHGGSLTLVMLDLDAFKQFNDSYGHIDGDIVLKSFARNFRLVLRKTDYAFRYGGDEFAIVLPMTTAEKAKLLLSRLRTKWPQVFSESELRTQNPLMFSAGIAEFPRDAETVDELISRADTALYKSKRIGRDGTTQIAETGGTF
jgi:diguanylate cyclase (GGDEF)-like protein/PAS domain S-box-containing protein